MFDIVLDSSSEYNALRSRSLFGSLSLSFTFGAVYVSILTEERRRVEFLVTALAFSDMVFLETARRIVALVLFIILYLFFVKEKYEGGIRVRKIGAKDLF
jgi:hypothetical protein